MTNCEKTQHPKKSECHIKLAKSFLFLIYIMNFGVCAYAHFCKFWHSYKFYLSLRSLVNNPHVNILYTPKWGFRQPKCTPDRGGGDPETF